MQLTLNYRLLALAAYTLLLVYGTWFPVDRWDAGLGGWGAFMAMEWPARIPRADLIINLLVYMPFGLAMSAVLRLRAFPTVALTAFLGFLLSACLEFGQTFLPGRVTSGSDLVLNTLGAGIGAAASRFVFSSQWLATRYQLVSGELRNAGTGHLGLLVLGLWVASQWAPFVPSLDLSNIKQGLAHFRALPSLGTTYFLLRCTEYAAMLLGLMALALRLFRDREQASRWLVALIAVVLAGKVLIMTRQLSPEAVLGAGFATVSTFWLRGQRSTTLRIVALVALLIYHAISTFAADPADTTLRTMNWIPFKGQMNSVTGLVDLVASLWLYCAYAYLMYPRGHRSGEGLALRLLLVAPWALFLELGQQTTPGRYPDITDVVVGVLAFTLASSYPWRKTGSSGNSTSPGDTRPWRRLATATFVGGALFLILGNTGNGPVDQSYSLPRLDELPNPLLPGFRATHPRLPAPTPDEWELLERENPEWVKRKRRGAGSSDFYTRTLLARTEPGTVDLDRLFNDLIELEFGWRGHMQTVPIAIAYDWLFEQWTPIQRSRLREKLEQACAYQTTVIRDKYELSPYNVFLYNSPLQALMMAAIALHEDSRSGDCMRFAHDYWKRRVLPVWSQIMGRRGGWHEGGEYVGIGIGQAIHRLPAMWRRATGEDLFATHEGIRGFVDFAMHRQRPDGSYMRLGDAGFFRKRIPDLAPLALEYRHAAGYTLANPPDKPTPLGFPWGPLSDNSLLDPAAQDRAPTQAWFDGIGLLTARSSWDDNATFVTFKAGNNYWSHMHLDQGSFTIFKGGALAIDSGLYFDYGGDHHLNYTYQSVAHNVVTVTDQNDTAAMPGKEKIDKQGQRVRLPDRPIANDGGQRRVGSGWGKRAPLDLADWRTQIDDYRTVGEVLVDTDLSDGVIWVNADLTPAYTNDVSSRGEFFARTRRVERYLRTLAYLPKLDIVLVHDRLKLSKPELRTRWLLHTLHEPTLSDNGFTVTAEHGQLEGQVLLPSAATLNALGGEGLEYFIGDRNYDENGKAQRHDAQRKGAEGGSWRIEIQAGNDARKLEFLVAMKASLIYEGLPSDTPNVPAAGLGMSLKEDGNDVIVEVASGVLVVLPRDLRGLRTRGSAGIL